MTRIRTTVATGQCTVASKIATTFDEVKITRLLTPHLAPVFAALKRKLVSYSSLLASLDLWLLILEHNFDNVSPRLALTGEQLGIAKEVETTLRSRQGNAGAVLGAQKTDRVVLVGADKRE